MDRGKVFFNMQKILFFILFIKNFLRELNKIYFPSKKHVFIIFIVIFIFLVKLSILISVIDNILCKNIMYFTKIE